MFNMIIEKKFKEDIQSLPTHDKLLAERLYKEAVQTD